MTLNKIPFYLVIILFLLIIYGLFTVKDNVMTLKFELQEVKKQVRNEEDTIRVLKAELAYLGSPERIQKLASEYLKLEKPKVAQIIKDPLINDVTDKNTQIANVEITKKPVKWRYKTGPAKYVTMAKGQK